jgi:hypothetical protein
LGRLVDAVFVVAVVPASSLLPFPPWEEEEEEEGEEEELVDERRAKEKAPEPTLVPPMAPPPLALNSPRKTGEEKDSQKGSMEARRRWRWRRWRCCCCCCCCCDGSRHHRWRVVPTPRLAVVLARGGVAQQGLERIVKALLRWRIIILILIIIGSSSSLEGGGGGSGSGSGSGGLARRSRLGGLVGRPSVVVASYGMIFVVVLLDVH